MQTELKTNIPFKIDRNLNKMFSRGDNHKQITSIHRTDGVVIVFFIKGPQQLELSAAIAKLFFGKDEISTDFYSYGKNVN